MGTQHWAQCNDVPVKYARFPVTGLVEGRSYVFRVRAVNKAGLSRPSRVSEAVVAMDPSDRARLRGGEDAAVPLSTLTPHQRLIFLILSPTAGPSAPWTGIIRFTEEDPAGATD